MHPNLFPKKLEENHINSNLILDIFNYKWYIIDVKDKNPHKGGIKMKKRIAERKIERQIEERKFEVLQRLYSEPRAF